jgi:C-terminal processing protease CtpA/Prc
MTTLYKKQYTPQFETEVKNYLKREIEIKKHIGVEFGVTLMKCEDEGLFVTKVKQGTPAWRTGIQVGDIILSINDKSINDDTHIQYLLYDLLTTPKINIIIKEYY